MGCRRQAKKAFKWFAGQMKPAVIQSARDIVLTLENEMFNALTGPDKELVATTHIKEVARREGQELTTTAAKVVVNGVLEALRRAEVDADELGVDDSADEVLD